MKTTTVIEPIAPLASFTVAQRWPSAVNRANWKSDRRAAQSDERLQSATLVCGSGGPVTDAEVIKSGRRLAP